MTDLPIPADLTTLPINTLLRRRNGSVARIIANDSVRPKGFPLVIEGGYVLARDGKDRNYHPELDIIAIAAWPPLTEAQINGEALEADK